MNEALCRALIAAGLSEEDVAARLEVDTRTVRRWLEGRLPYRRFRWALAAMLGVDDGDLWPGLRGDGGRPDEVVAVYPHRDQVPAGVWLRLLDSARREIGILTRGGMFLAGLPGAVDVLRDRAGAGVRVRICLRDPGAPAAARHDEAGGARADPSGGALNLYGPLRVCGDVQIRLYLDDPYNDMCFADERLMVLQRAYGIPAGRCPVLELQRRAESAESDLFAEYLGSFERGWSKARPLLTSESDRLD